MFGLRGKFIKMLSDWSFDRTITSLPELASKDPKSAVDLLKSLAGQASDDPIRFARLTYTGRAILPTIGEGSRGFFAYDIVDTLVRASRGDPERTARVIRSTLEIVPDVLKLNVAAAARILEPLGYATKMCPAYRDQVVDAGFEVLRLLPASDTSAASSLAATLVEASSRGEPDRFARAFETALGMVPSVAAQSGSNAFSLVESLADVSQDDPDRAARVIEAGIQIIPSLRVDLAEILVRTLTRTAKGDPAHLAKVVDAGLSSLPLFAESCVYRATEFFSKLADTAKTLPEDSLSRVIDAGLKIFPRVAQGSGLASRSLVETLLTVGGVDAERGVLCREFALTGGKKNEYDHRRTLIAFGNDANQSKVLVGPFKDCSLATMKRIVDTSVWGRDQYDQELVQKAFSALARRPNLLSFRDLVKKAKPQAPAAA